MKTCTTCRHWNIKQADLLGFEETDEIGRCTFLSADLGNELYRSPKDITETGVEALPICIHDGAATDFYTAQDFVCAHHASDEPEENTIMNGIERIAAERKRQIEKEGWTAEHDDDHIEGDLATAAAGYVEATAVLLSYGSHTARADYIANLDPPCDWPWADHWWKPSTEPIRNLEKAGALIAAEIDRLLRLRRKAE